MGNLLCMGLSLQFLAPPSPSIPNCPDHCLAAGMHMHVLNGHLLLALSAMPIESLKQRRPSAGEFICLFEFLPPTFHGFIV
jgi:hypothetical protein